MGAGVVVWLASRRSIDRGLAEGGWMTTES
jgi:hypothetical protein